LAVDVSICPRCGGDMRLIALANSDTKRNTPVRKE